MPNIANFIVCLTSEILASAPLRSAVQPTNLSRKDLKLKFLNTTHDFRYRSFIWKLMRSLVRPPCSSKQDPSPEMRRQAAIAVTAVFEVRA
jgi:hypothetical protein